jgi:hypothetical protein
MRRASIFRAGQEGAVARIKDNAEFTHAGVKVLSRLVANIQSEIDHALVSGAGLTMFVFPLHPVSAKPNMPGPHFDEVVARVRIFENPTTNRLGFDAYDAWEEIVSEAGLHRYRIPGLAQIGHFHIDAEPFFDMSAKYPGNRVFDAIFRSQVNLTNTP